MPVLYNFDEKVEFEGLELEDGGWYVCALGRYKDYTSLLALGCYNEPSYAFSELRKLEGLNPFCGLEYFVTYGNTRVVIDVNELPNPSGEHVTIDNNVSGVLPHTNRVELIRGGTREVVSYGAEDVSFLVQDFGRTLKVFYRKDVNGTGKTTI